MNNFALVLTEELGQRGIDLGELSPLLVEHGADEWDARPSTIATALYAERVGERPALHPKTWAALNKILGDLGREEFVVLMWTYYLDGIDVDAA
jgi:hypothetical protein